ncbi:MAG TPA: ribonuclease HII [Methanocorpusculum sp.]|nr:ribonuclease HII [Methanocorpusculum sp.]
MRICGIDEAGKGPVLGPMTAAGVVVEGPDALNGLGIKDSKQLTPKKREELFEVIVGTYPYHVVVKSPQEIDARPGTMNAFTVSCHAEVLRNLVPDKVILDACDVNADRFGTNVLSASGISCDVVSIHKADAKYTVVGAASIVAKVTRDRIIETLREEFGDIGSGYPSDEVTVQFLKTYIETYGAAPSCARTTWQTTIDILNASHQKSLDSFF